MRILAFYILIFSVCGCFLAPHKVLVRQGNFIDSQMVAKLEVGMNKRQVRYILGTPLIRDVFHPERWDYVFTQGSKGGAVEKDFLVLEFENDLLSRIQYATE